MSNVECRVYLTAFGESLPLVARLECRVSSVGWDGYQLRWGGIWIRGEKRVGSARGGVWVV